MSGATVSAVIKGERARRLVWLPPMWPAIDRIAWADAPRDGNNPAAWWSGPTVKKNADGYGRYLGWLSRAGLLVEDEEVRDRITARRVVAYTAELKTAVSSASVGAYMNALSAAARALSPEHDWRWLSHRATRLKLKAVPTREKRQAIRPTIELYRFGKQVMDRIGPPQRLTRYQSGLIIALLSARPLRIRNFQAIAIGSSLRWDGARYWLTFNAEDTKTGGPIDEPVPNDLVGYLEVFLRHWRPVLVRRAPTFGGDPTHRRLWVDRFGAPMREATLRELIKRYTRARYGIALWPHLFRDCLLTSVAVDQPDLMGISATLLGHSRLATGEKHYNQARMLDASRRYGRTIAGIRDTFLRVEGS